MSEGLIVSTTDVAWETWEPEQIPTRGRVSWKTLFSHGRTNTDSLTVGMAIVHPNDALYPHHHSPSEIYFILHGEGVVTLGEQEHVVHAADAVFIPANLRHGIANRSDADVIFLYAFAEHSFDGIEYHFPEGEETF